MAVTKESFLASYPEFAAVNSTAVENELNFQNSLVNADNFGNFRDRAVFLVTAHRLVLRHPISGVKSQSTPGVVTAQQAQTGGLSVQTTVSAMVSGDKAFRADMARTNYGLELLSLMDTVIAPGMMV